MTTNCEQHGFPKAECPWCPHAQRHYKRLRDLVPGDAVIWPGEKVPLEVSGIQFITDSVVILDFTDNTASAPKGADTRIEVPA